MGETLQAGVFSKCELAVGAGVTIIVASMVMIQSNFLGFAANVVLIFSGFMLAAGTVALYDFFHIPAIPFMILSGVAAFASVVPLGAPFWERLIAFLAIEDVTSAYPIQLAGALGCMGTVTVFLIQAVGVPWDHLQFYR